MEADRRLELLGGAEPAGGLLDLLDAGVAAFAARIGQTMAQAGQQVRQVAAEAAGDSGGGSTASFAFTASR